MRARRRVVQSRGAGFAALFAVAVGSAVGCGPDSATPRAGAAGGVSGAGGASGSSAIGGVGAAGTAGDTSSGAAGSGGSEHQAGAAGAADSGGQAGAGSGWNGTLDLSQLGGVALATPAAPGVDAAQARAATILATLSQANKVALVQGSSGQFIGNVPNVGSLPALTLQDGPAGVARMRGVTAFPAPITLAATWDRDLVQRWGAAMSAEERGKGVMIQLGPMMNLARTTNGGRNFEGFGEDPYLSSELAGRDVTGIQSQKVVATAKHFVGNEQETNRMSGNSQIDERTLHEIYYPPFEASVSAGAGAVMCSYNQLNGIYACENSSALGDLKGPMGFSGWVMSDWSATHSVLAANAGLDMEMPSGARFNGLLSAIDSGDVAASRLDDMVLRILTSLLRVGVLDDPPTGTPSDDVTSVEHTDLAREAAIRATTLLKNEHQALPLGADVTSIAVIGSDASTPLLVGGGSAAVLAGPSTTPLQAITARAGSGVTVTYSAGLGDPRAGDPVQLAAQADVAIVFASATSQEGFDRPSLSLDGTDGLIAAVAAANPRTIVVLNVPSAVTMPWLDQASAVLVSWYPGQEFGNAVTSLLFGDSNPSGKLPVTFPVAATDLPMASQATSVVYSEGLEVGYRSLDAHDVAPLFPFGYGLSYSSFAYSDLVLDHGSADGSLRASFELENQGDRSGDEVAELYLSFPESAGEPPRLLRGFERVTLAPGERRAVQIELPPVAFSCWSAESHRKYVPSGTFQVWVGRSSRDLPLQASLQVVGIP